RAVVTVGADQLIERALEDQQVPHVVAYDGMDLESARAGLGAGTVPVLQVHGCASGLLSLSDTLKRRLLGRNRDLHQWAEGVLRDRHGVQVGCSTDPLADADQLSFLPGAAGATVEQVRAAPDQFFAALGEALDLPAFNPPGLVGLAPASLDAPPPVVDARPSL